MNLVLNAEMEKRGQAAKEIEEISNALREKQQRDYLAEMEGMMASEFREDLDDGDSVKNSNNASSANSEYVPVRPNPKPRVTFAGYSEESKKRIFGTAVKAVESEKSSLTTMGCAEYARNATESAEWTESYGKDWWKRVRDTSTS